MKRTLLLLLFALSLSYLGRGQVNISAGSTITQDFTIGTNATATMPTGWKVDKNTTVRSVGTYSGAGTATEQRAGNSMSSSATGGIYNYAAGDPTSATERAVGGISSSSAAKSVNTYVQLTNNGAGSITSFTISYNVEKYRKGTNAAGFSIQMYYSTNGTSWTSAGSDFLTSFAGSDADNNGYTTAPGATSSVSSKTLTVTVTSASSLYLAWNYSVTSGTTTSNAQALGIDDVSITANGTVTSASSDIIGAANETSNIAYASYQASSITATSDAVRLFSYTIRDGGGSADADALPTILSSITFGKGASNSVTNWANTLRQAALFDGTTKVAEVSVTGETIPFTGLSGANVTAADDGSKTLDLYVTFESAATDNQQFQFQITNGNVTAASSGSSGFTAFTAVNSSVTSDANRIEVTASDIIFDQNVSTVALGAVMSPSPTLQAIDGNVNYDLDYAEAWSVAVTTGTATFDGTATTSGNFTNGLATLSNLKFDAAGTGNKITVTSGSNTDESSSFDVTNPLPEINLIQSSTNYLTSSTYAFGNQLSGSSSSAITFTVENLGSATLNLTGTPIVDKSGTNSAEFTIDQTPTSSAVGVASTTTFTITFSPTSQGAKTAQISIANDDATGSENPYIINLTGSGTVSSASDIANTSGYSYTSNVAYASFQTGSTLTTGNSVGVNGLTLRDGSGTTDADNLGSTLTAISFTTGGSTAIRTAALFVDGANVSEVAVNGATTILFSGLNITATDNGTKDFELRVTYQGTVTDNQQITFTVSSATASSSGSGFAAANAGGASSSATGDINRIEVTATVLVFGVNPNNVTINSLMSPSPTVIALDANANTDLDFVGDVTLTSTGTISGTATNPVTAVSGTATFSNLKFSVLGTGITIAGSSGSLTSTGNSSSFNVTVQAAGLLLSEENFNYTSATNLTANGWSAHSSGGTNPIKVHTSGLSFSGYGSTAIANAAIINASGEDVNKTFTQQNSGSTTYCAFLINISSATTGGDYIMHLGPTTISSEFRCRLYTKYTGGNLTFGISTTGNTINYATTNYAYNTTYLVVIKHFFNGTTQTSSLFINPSLTSEPSTPDATETSTTSLSTNMGTVAIRQSSTSNIAIIDGIRVGTNWGVVLGNPQYDESADIAAGNYNDVSLLSGTLTQIGNVTTKGTLALTGGTFNVGSNTLTIGGPISMGSGTVNNSTGTVDFAQTSTTTIPWTSFNNMTTSGTGPFSLFGNTTVGGNLTIGSGSVLNIASDKQLTVTGTLTNSAGNTGLVVKSDATGTGSLITTSSPSSTVERYMAEDNYHYISSPVALQNVSPEFVDFTGAVPAYIDFYTWDETKVYSWINSKTSTSTWNGTFDSQFGLCKGYVYANSSNAVTKSFTGTLNAGDKTILMTKSPNGQRGWNLIGNPFPSTVALNYNANSSSNLLDDNVGNLSSTMGAIYLWDQTTPYTSTHTTNDYIPINNSLEAKYLAPGQAFMVCANSQANFSFKQAARKHGSATFYKSGETDEVNRFWLTVAGPQNNFNETMVAMIPGTTNGMDAGYDAQKLKGNVNIALYTRLVDGSEGDYAIQSIDQLSGNFVVPVGLDANLTGNYTFKAGRMDNLEAVTVQLEDRNSGTFTTISNGGEYSINVSNTGAINNRFFLHLKSTVGIDDPANQEASSIYAYGNQLYIQNPSKATLEVYSMTGQRVMASQINTTGLYQTTVSQPMGYYVVRLTNAGSTQVSKVFIK